eukprot:4082636-Pyramimonas_sp.AAC.1
MGLGQGGAASHVLAGFSEPRSKGNAGAALEVHSDCAGSVSCARSSIQVLDPRIGRRHKWRLRRPPLARSK